MAAHFKPFTRAASGAPSHRNSSRRSWSDCSEHHHRRRYRKRNSGLIVLDL